MTLLKDPPPPKQYQRTYAEAENWQDVTEAEVRYRLSGYHTDVDEAIATINAGQQLRTPFAFFRLKIQP